MLRNINDSGGIQHLGSKGAQRERVMHLRASHKSSRLPKRFPVGATYVVEGRAGARGQLLVSSRYVALPGGRRIDISADTHLPSHGRSRLSTPSGRGNWLR
jgi:hypothetical protein